MRRHHRLLVLLLLAGVFGGFAVLPVDLPETAFDESDAPVSLAPPSTLLSFVPSCYRPNRDAGVAVLLSRVRCRQSGDRSGSHAAAASFTLFSPRSPLYVSDLKAVPLVQNARIFNAGTCSAEMQCELVCNSFLIDSPRIARKCEPQ